jgi:hypothetical protein
VVVTVAGRRDEASYRTAVDRAMTLIAEPGPPGAAPATAMSEPAAVTTEAAALPPPIPPPP